jgi:P-type conjugative transfer protein TrbJ
MYIITYTKIFVNRKERLKMLKKLLIALVITFLAPRLCAAMTVNDPQLIAVQRKSQADQITNTLNNLKQLEAMLKNMESMDKGVGSSNQANLQKVIAGLREARAETNALTVNYKDFQQSWDENYVDFQQVNGLTAMDYYKIYQKNTVNVDKAAKTAMMSQGLVAQIDDDADVLDMLMKSSDSADGALKVAQIGNQMTALLIQNVMRLQQITSLSERAQTQYMLQQQQNVAASSAGARGQPEYKKSTLQGRGLRR